MIATAGAGGRSACGFRPRRRVPVRTPRDSPARALTAAGTPLILRAFFQTLGLAPGPGTIYPNRSPTLANSAQAKKRVRQAEKARQHNASLRSTFRTYVKKVIAAIATGDKSKAETAYQEASSIIDRTARKGLIHANKAARHKSRLAGHIKAMSA